MAQWGKTRRFEHDGAEITVMAHVDTGSTFAPIGRGSKIDLLILADQKGDQEACAALFAVVKSTWIGSNTICLPIRRMARLI